MDRKKAGLTAACTVVCRTPTRASISGHKSRLQYASLLNKKKKITRNADRFDWVHSISFSNHPTFVVTSQLVLCQHFYHGEVHVCQVRKMFETLKKALMSEILFGLHQTQRHRTVSLSNKGLLHCEMDACVFQSIALSVPKTSCYCPVYWALLNTVTRRCSL